MGEPARSTQRAPKQRARHWRDGRIADSVKNLYLIGESARGMELRFDPKIFLAIRYGFDARGAGGGCAKGFKTFFKRRALNYCSGSVTRTVAP